MQPRKARSGPRPRKKGEGVHAATVMLKPEDVSEAEELFVHILRRIVHAKIARRDGSLVRNTARASRVL